MMPLRSSSCCDKSASVPGAVRGMTFMAESQAATNPFSFSCAIGLSKSSCSAACSLALIASSASLRQRKTLFEACSSAIRIAWLVGPGGAGESAPVAACEGWRRCRENSFRWQRCNRRSASTIRKVVSRYAVSKVSVACATCIDREPIIKIAAKTKLRIFIERISNAVSAEGKSVQTRLYPSR